MDFQIYHLKTKASTNSRDSVLVIYTGGTIGMDYDEAGKSLIPYDFGHIMKNVPELSTLDVHITVMAFKQPIDSSNMNPAVWIDLGRIIFDEIENFTGFVVLHGTDTMAYTSSAISFMLENLKKPVVFTGAQLPIGSRRSDARENFITAIEIALARDNGAAIVPEVSILFDNKLFRANRCRKVESNLFDAFQSDNYPLLAEAGVRIRYFRENILKPDENRPVAFHHSLGLKVCIIKIYPGLSPNFFGKLLLEDEPRLIILETYGSGNVPTESWFIKGLNEAINAGKIILAVSQCPGGKVVLGKYATSKYLLDMGVVGGSDLTTEAALAKAMYLLGNCKSNGEIVELLGRDLRGELSE